MAMSRDEYLSRASEFAPRGEQVGVSRLNAEKVRWIRSNPSGLTIREMARALDVHYRTVEKAHYYETWRHVK